MSGELRGEGRLWELGVPYGEVCLMPAEVIWQGQGRMQWGKLRTAGQLGRALATCCSQGQASWAVATAANEGGLSLPAPSLPHLHAQLVGLPPWIDGVGDRRRGTGPERPRPPCRPRVGPRLRRCCASAIGCAAGPPCCCARQRRLAHHGTVPAGNTSEPWVPSAARRCTCRPRRVRGARKALPHNAGPAGGAAPRPPHLSSSSIWLSSMATPRSSSWWMLASLEWSPRSISAAMRAASATLILDLLQGRGAKGWGDDCKAPTRRPHDRRVVLRCGLQCALPCRSER